MAIPSSRTVDDAPLLIVTDVGARLVRRGLLTPADGASARWSHARVLVFRHGPVLVEPALTGRFGGPTFQPRR